MKEILIDGQWVIVPADENGFLARIGHTSISETFFLKFTQNEEIKYHTVTSWIL